MARRGPGEAAGIVVDNADQILVAVLVTDLVNPDPVQVRELVVLCFSVSAQTRVMIAATVRHAMRINTVMAVLDVCVVRACQVFCVSGLILVSG